VSPQPFHSNLRNSKKKKGTQGRGGGGRGKRKKVKEKKKFFVGTLGRLLFTGCAPVTASRPAARAAGKRKRKKKKGERGGEMASSAMSVCALEPLTFGGPRDRHAEEKEKRRGRGEESVYLNNPIPQSSANQYPTRKPRA